jgi:hypothetical protein
MVRLVLRWLDSPWAFELMPGLNKLGRNPTNDFRISDPSVSSFHAEVSLENDQIRVRDLGSTNGTFIDDRRIAGEEEVLKPEHILRLGNVRLQLDEVAITPLAEVSAVPSAAAAAASEQVELTPVCAYHRELRANYRCESCGGAFCNSCVTVLGQDRSGPTTICPMCHSQCYPLTEPHAKVAKPSLLGRLTQTLKIPFGRY